MTPIFRPPSVPIRSRARFLAGSLLGSPESTPELLDRIFLLLAVTAAGMAALLALLPPAGHDQLWFLLMAERWLGYASRPAGQIHGAQIYGPEIFDSNPPGIVWLSAVPVLLSRWLHLPVTLGAKSLVVVAETAASLLSFSFLRRIRPSDIPAVSLPGRSRRRSFEPAALLFAALILFYVVPARDFGQRDQILSFLVLPYVLAAAIDPHQQPLTLARCTAGVLAAAGICLKPHHALVPIAVELALLVGGPGLAAPVLPPRRTGSARLRRLFRPEPVVIAALGVAYLVAIHPLTPLYFTRALPLLRDTYWAIGHLSAAALALQAIELCVVAAMVVGLFLAVQPRSPVVGLLIVAGSAATLVFFLQGTGWYYQQLPAIGFFGAALTLELLDLLERPSSGWPAVSRGALPGAAALCVLALALTTWATGAPFTRDRAYAPIFADPSVPDPAFFTGLKSQTPVAILTTSVEATMMPVARFHLTWAQRTNNLWLLPAILRGEAGLPHPHRLSSGRLMALDALQHRWMVEDLNRWRPQLILVARCQTEPCQELEDLHRAGQPQIPGPRSRPDDLLAWFLSDPAFVNLWKQYTWSGNRGEFDAYTLRQPPSPAGGAGIAEVAAKPRMVR